MNCRDGQKQLAGCLNLLVDDHKDSLEAIRLFLERRRANVLAVTGCVRTAWISQLSINLRSSFPI
jgi:hypothetical protein